jgi:hypothetical protein
MAEAALKRLAVVLIVWAAFCGEAMAQAERRVALVIGNGSYREAPLRNPVNDSRAMAIALEETGFAVTRIENADRLAMQRAVLAFGKALSRDAIGLFYYAGHGMQVRGTNYLIPINAQAQSEDEVEVEAVDVNYVLARMATAENRLNIVILDACRDNPFARAFRSGGRGLAAITAPTGTLIAYATAPGATAADGTGANGLFTGELITAVSQAGLRVEDVFKRTRMAVVEKSRGRQTPWESSSLMGDFYFQPTTAPVAAAAPPPRPVPAPAPPPPAPVAAAAAVAPSAPVAAPPPPAAPMGPPRSMHALDCPAPGLVLKTSAGERLTAIAPAGATCRWRNASGAEFANVGPFLPLAFGANHEAIAAMRGLELGRIGAEAGATRMTARPASSPGAGASSAMSR